ncbi:MAG: hypothetical protein LIP23_10075 [Planctomycetes bacterium]|nr:hypothetical protein [Planctomycetota bacterium]
MSTKTVFTILALACLGLGIGISGCNRSRDTAMRPTKRNPNAVRPAEVLSASAYRPPVQRHIAAAPAQPGYIQTNQPQPGYQTAAMTQPRQQFQPRQPQQHQQQQRQYAQQPQQYYAMAPAAMVQSRPHQQVTRSVPASREPAQGYQYIPAQSRQRPERQYHPTPELAMARANLEPVRIANHSQLPAPVMRAPIPELEPPRFARVTYPVPHLRPSAEVMVSGVQPQRQEVQQALTPLRAPTNSRNADQGWVASPTTAMRSGAVRAW